jgi:F-type H+-transporting ATPase subunit c
MTKRMLFLMVLLIVACPLFAQSTGGAPAAWHGDYWWVAIGAGIGMAIGSGLCALGQGKAIAGACEGMARNPGVAPAIRAAMILGLVFIESLALYVMVIIFIVVKP